MTPEDEDVRMMQREISDVLIAHGRRIRYGNDLATVRRVLGEVQAGVAEFLRKVGDAPEVSGPLPATASPPAEVQQEAPAGADGMSAADRAKMLAADDLAQGRVVGSRGAPASPVRAITEQRWVRELEREDAESALCALQAKCDQLQDELTRARAEAADALAQPASSAWSQMRAMARRVLVRHVEAGGAADPVCAGPDGEPVTAAQMIERLDAGEDVSAFLDSLTGAALRLMRAELRTAKPAPERQG